MTCDERRVFFLIDEVAKLRNDLQDLDLRIGRYEGNPSFDAFDVRYQRIVAEKKLLLEHLCEIRSALAVVIKGNVVPSAPLTAESTPSDSKPQCSPVINKEIHPQALQIMASAREAQPSPSVGSHRSLAPNLSLSSSKHNQSAPAPALPQILPATKEPSTSGSKRSREEIEIIEEAPAAAPEPEVVPYTIDKNPVKVEEIFHNDDEEEGEVRSDNAGEDSSATKKKRFPDLQLDEYATRKQEVSKIMKSFTDKKVVLVAKDGSVVTVQQYQVIKELAKQGEDISSLLRGSMEKYVTNVDKKKGEVTEKSVFVPEYRVYREMTEN